jgi:hypothetical protein
MQLRYACLLGCIVLSAAQAAGDDSLFPFVVSPETPANVTNVSILLPCPAGKDGFVSTRNSHFATAAGPIRFWATNVCFEGCFCSHELAERLAARLARFGVNCVRMHHMDNSGIWGKSPDHTTIDPEKLERLDYLIYQLKLHGVYTNLNLHVSRWFDQREGFVARDQRPNYDKGLDNFEPRMIELQRKYARDLLTHVNPYTKTAYAQEPAVAFVEINNENALFDQWQGGSIDRLPEPYATTFRKLWNAWLRKKYGTTDAVAKVWNVGQEALGDEMLRGGDFSQPPEKNWGLERDAQTKVQWQVRSDGPDGHAFLQVVVERLGQVSWHPQFSQDGLTVAKGRTYTLACRLRADDRRSLEVNCMTAHDPWERIGLSTRLDAGPQWREQRVTFVASQDDAKARITFTGLKPGTYCLADVSLRPGGIIGVAKGERIEDDGVAVLRHSLIDRTEPARQDFIDFLWETERQYWGGMYRYLKDGLGVRPLVTGTQLGYSPVHVQAGMDYIDAHSYWHHPHFPGRSWDSRNWYVQNAALVNTPGGTLAGLAGRRVAGMAFTVSEYNHPAPIAYAAEGFPMTAAFGAFQGWDAIYSFAWSHNADFESRHIGGFFDLRSDPNKLVHHPACAAMFLRGDVLPAKTVVRVPLSPEDERRKLYDTRNSWSLSAEQLGADKLASPADSAAAKPTAGQAATEWVSDTGQLRWNVSQPGAGYFTVDTPRSKLFTGFVHGRSFRLGDVTLSLGKTRLDWATVSMTAMEGSGFAGPGRVLIAATGWIQNTDAKIEELGEGRVTLRDRWGHEPTLCEGVDARVELPVPAERVHLYPLDEAGNRRQAVAVTNRDGRAVLPLGSEHKTLWYEVEITR